jgi:hypothetical protein
MDGNEMEQYANTRPTFLLSTTVTWAIFGIAGSWFLNSTLLQRMSNGFMALAVVGFVGVVFISLVQRLYLDGSSFFLILLATGLALGIGSIGASLAFLAVMSLPLVRGSSGISIVDWLIWPLSVFILSAIGSIPGGLISGLMMKGAVKRGKLSAWIVNSVSNWALSFGVAGVLFLILIYPQYFYIPTLRTIPVVIRGGLIGVLIGLIQGKILGNRIRQLDQIRTDSVES